MSRNLQKKSNEKAFFKTFKCFLIICLIYLSSDAISSMKIFLNFNNFSQEVYNNNSFIIDNYKFIVNMIISLLIYLFIYLNRKKIESCKKIFAATLFYNVFFGLAIFLNPYNLINFNIFEAAPKLMSQLETIIDSKKSMDVQSIQVGELMLENFNYSEIAIITVSNFKKENNFYTNFIDEKSNEIKNKESLNYISKILLPLCYAATFIIVIFMYTLFTEFGGDQKNYYNVSRFLAVINLFFVYYHYYFNVFLIIDKNYEDYFYIVKLLNLTVLNFSVVTLYYLYCTNKNTLDRLRTSNIFEKPFFYFRFFILILLLQLVPITKNEFGMEITALYSLVIAIFIKTLAKFKLDIKENINDSIVVKNRDMLLQIVFFSVLFCQIFINYLMQDEYVVNKSITFLIIMMALIYLDILGKMSSFVVKNVKKLEALWN